MACKYLFCGISTETRTPDASANTEETSVVVAEYIIDHIIGIITAGEVLAFQFIFQYAVKWSVFVFSFHFSSMGISVLCISSAFC